MNRFKKRKRGDKKRKVNKCGHCRGYRHVEEDIQRDKENAKGTRRNEGVDEGRVTWGLKGT